MSKVHIYARNLAANWFGQISGLLVVFFMSPFVVHTLGRTEYGIWGLLNVLTGYLGLFDLGVRASTGRYVILYVGRQDHDRVNETLRTGLSFFSRVSIVIFLAAVGVGFAFPYLFPTVPVEYHDRIRILLPLLAMNVFLSAISGAFASILAAHDRFDLQQVVDISVLVLRTGATVAVLLAGFGIVGMTAVAIGASALAAAGNWWMAHRVYPHLRVRPLTMSRERLRELFGYGIPAFLSNVAGKIVGQADLIVVGVLLGVKAVTTYSVGAMLVWYSTPLIDHVAGVIFPSIQRSVAIGDTPSVRWTYIRMLKAVLAFGLLVYLGYMFFGDFFIRLWMGEGFSESFTVMAILSASKLVQLASGGAGTLLYATGRVWFLTIVIAIEAVLNLALSLVFVLVLKWGMPGVAAGTLVSTILVRVWVQPWYANREIGLKAGVFVARALIPGIIAGAAFAGWCFLLRTFVPAHTWVLFAAQVGLALAGYVPIALFVLVPLEDRKRVFRFLRILPADAG